MQQQLFHSAKKLSKLNKTNPSILLINYSTIIQKRNLLWVPKDEVIKKGYKTPIPEKDIPKEVNYTGPETLRVAFCLERLPRLANDIHPLEKEMSELQKNNMNYYSKHKWLDFTEYYEEWLKIKKKQENQKGAKKEGPDVHIKVPDPQEMTEKQRMEYEKSQGKGYMTESTDYWLKNWKPQRRFTKDDFNDNRKSINRQLENRLYLIFKDKETGKWLFPHTIRKNPHTMRSAAQEFFTKTMSNRVHGHFIGYAPTAHYVNPNNPLDMTFFYRVMYIGGVPPFKALAPQFSDHAWVTRHQFDDYEFIDEEYKDVIFHMLYDGMQPISG
ncbi:hypothetical protein ABK040_004891 [Willaertia magna]